MNQKTPILGKQLSSSLRERLKKCGRYHASPQSSSSRESSMKGTPVKICHPEKDSITSPQSRKRSATSPLDDERIHNENITPSGNVNLGKGTAVSLALGANEEKDTEVVETPVNLENRTLDQNIIRTPLSSRSRSKHVPIKSSRLNFQCKNEVLQESQDESGNPMLKDSSQAMPVSENMEGHDHFKLSVTVSNPKSSDNCSKNVNENAESGAPVTRCGLMKEIAGKEETLRKLKMVKTYRTKNNLTELQLLIDKWRDVSQQALQDLQSEMPDPKPTLTQLINHLGIQHSLIEFDAEEETFNS